MSPPSQQLIALRALRSTSTDPAQIATLDTLIAQLELAATSHEQSISDGASIGVAVAGNVFGSITVVDPAHTVSLDQQLARAHHSLLARHFPQALAECAHILRDHFFHSRAHLFNAIALLGGNYADRTDEATIRRIEASLLAAAFEPELSATAWAILGIIKIDVDVSYSRKTLLYSFNEIRKQLADAGAHTIDHQLLHLVHTTERTRRKIFS
ncbi:hypothetical protein SE17_13030 [Kouleothrix aurantiaca]|uniref:Uncharacterized protein n=1 Tax=Kouleothrix aurantiaca TaxID=186479 RepID=A0A0P9F8E6_9CHLR|nr:hypothetical protein SE17_13030 [Kouleothrix aurantiaca]